MLSITVPSVPWPVPSGANVTVPPDLTRLLPLASLSWMVSVVEAKPSAVSDPAAGVAMLVAAVASPTVRIVAGLVKLLP